jgi:hypothetical protein
MKRLLTILLLLAAGTAYGQINNPVTAGSLGLGTTNSPVFSAITLTEGDELQINGGGIYSVGFNGAMSFEEQRLTQDSQTIFSWETNSFAVTPAATFATNVSIAGSLTVGSLTTTTPSTWALDATQTAAATNGRLILPSNGNVIRLTNNNAISSVTNGVLGAFYYLVNQATNAVTISNVGGITIDGAQNLTLSPNESATLVATGTTNVSVANRGDLTDVALGGTANTAPSQTASSGSSLMTRELSDDRYRIFYVPLVHALSSTAASGSTWNLRPFHSADAVFSVPPWARNVRINLSTGFTNAPISNNLTAVITAYSVSTTNNTFGSPFAQTTNALSVTQVWSNGSNSYRFILRMTNDLALPSDGISDAESASFWNILIQLRNNSSGSLTTVSDNWLRGMAVFTD